MSTASQVAAKQVYACILNVMSMCVTGNHETTTCTTMYGFKVELDRKFGNQDAKLVYQTCKRVFSHLPLAAIISDSALVVHGGLFRKPAQLASTKVSFIGDRQIFDYYFTERLGCCLVIAVDTLRPLWQGFTKERKGRTMTSPLE